MSKWLKELDKSIVGTKGEEIKPNGKDVITVKELIISAVFVDKATTPAESIRKINKIIPMLNAAKQAIELEDQDFDIIKKAVENNPEQRIDGIWGQMLILFEATK